MSKRTRTLALRAETVRQLSGGEAELAAGGQATIVCTLACRTAQTVPQCNTMITYTYVPSGCGCTGLYPSLNDPCSANACN
jgi:hypothetical protein